MPRADRRTFFKSRNIPPISELTGQPGQGLLRALKRAGAGAVETRLSERSVDKGGSAMHQVNLGIVLFSSLVTSMAFAQIAEQRSEQRPTRQEPPDTGVRSLAETGSRVPATPVKQFERQPEMVIVKALIVTVSFGESKGSDRAESTATAGVESVAHALVKKINTEVGVKRTPMSTLMKALDDVIKEQVKIVSIQTLSGFELTTIAGQSAFVQIGHRKPRIVGTTFSQQGRTNNLDMENVGTILQITPQVVPDGALVLAVDIESSDLGPEAEGIVMATTDDGTEIRSPQVDTMTLKTTVTTANGQVVVVNDLICDRQQMRKETFILLRPLVLGATGSQ